MWFWLVFASTYVFFPIIHRVLIWITPTIDGFHNPGRSGLPDNDRAFIYCFLWIMAPFFIGAMIIANIVAYTWLYVLRPIRDFFYARFSVETVAEFINKLFES